MFCSWHTDRVALRGLPPICHVSTKQVLGKFTVLQRQQILMEISGSFQTRSQQASWDTSVDGSCLACGQPDTREHRIHVCPVFSDIRVQFRRILDHFCRHGFVWFMSCQWCLSIRPLNLSESFRRNIQRRFLLMICGKNCIDSTRTLQNMVTVFIFTQMGCSCQFSASTETCFGALCCGFRYLPE